MSVSKTVTSDFRFEEFANVFAYKNTKIIEYTETGQFPNAFCNKDINKQSELASAATANQIIQKIKFVLKAVIESLASASDKRRQ